MYSNYAEIEHKPCSEPLETIIEGRQSQLKQLKKLKKYCKKMLHSPIRYTESRDHGETLFSIYGSIEYNIDRVNTDLDKLYKELDQQTKGKK